MASKLVAALAALFLLSACESPPEDSARAGVEPHSRVDNQEMPFRELWVFDGLLKGLSSREHYVLEAVFVEAEGRVVLHSHFNGFAWRDGVRIAFTRAQGHVHMEITVPGFASRVEELPTNFLNAEGRFKARIEVHNGGGSGVRVLLWKYGFSQKGELENARPFISPGNADFDSHEPGWVFNEHGRGAQWGLEFERARILLIHREAPYVP